MKYSFLINPVSGKGGHGDELAKSIKTECEARSLDHEIYFTTGVGSAFEYVKEFAEKYPKEKISFFACGGDGTLGEVVNGVMASEGRERLCVGVIPVGTGNDFVRNFSEGDFSDIGAQIDGSDIKIDLISCNGIFCVNMVNIGFDCEVVCKKASLQRNKMIPSKLAYIIGLAITLIRKPGVKCRISLDGGEYEDKELLLTTFGNGEYCGGGFHSNPESRINNGKINALTVNNISRRKFVSIVGSYKKGTHLVHKDLLQSTLNESLCIDFYSPTNISVDGEVIKVEKHLSMCAVKEAVNFILPRGIKYLKEKEKAEENSACTV